MLKAARRYVKDPQQKVDFRLQTQAEFLADKITYPFDIYCNESSVDRERSADFSGRKKSSLIDFADRSDQRKYPSTTGTERSQR